MRLVGRIIIFIALFWALFIITIPKETLFYLLQNQLSKHGVFVYADGVKGNLLSANLNKTSVIYNDYDILSAESISIFPWLFFNEIKAQGIQMPEIVTSTVGIELDSYLIKYSIINPLLVKFEAKANYADIDGSFNIFDKVLKVDLYPNNDFKPTVTFSNLFTFKDGIWSYEYKL